MKGAFIGMSIYFVILETVQDFTDMFLVINRVVRIDQDVIEVNEYVYIQ